MSFYPLPNRPPATSRGANNFSANYVVGHPGRISTWPRSIITSATSDRSPAAISTNGGPALIPASSRSRRRSRAIRPKTSSITLRHLDPHHQSDHGQRSALHLHLPAISTTSPAGAGRRLSVQLGLQGVPDDAFPQFAPAGFSAARLHAQERQQYPIQQHQCGGRFLVGQRPARDEIRRRSAGARVITNSTSLPSRAPSLSPPRPPDCPAMRPPASAWPPCCLASPPTLPKQTQELDRTSWYLAAFAQDDWTITPSLTLNLGVRWETDTPMVDANNRMNGFDPYQINPVSRHARRGEVHGPERFPHHAYQHRLEQFRPALGFAWKPFGSDKTVVRGGFGIFYCASVRFAASPTRRRWASALRPP